MCLTYLSKLRKEEIDDYRFAQAVLLGERREKGFVLLAHARVEHGYATIVTLYGDAALVSFSSRLSLMLLRHVFVFPS